MPTAASGSGSGNGDHQVFERPRNTAAGALEGLEEDIKLLYYKYHTIELVLDRLKAEADKRSRIVEAVEQAQALADGLVAVVRGDAEGGEGEDYRIFSTQRACPNGHGSIPEMEPGLF